MQRRERSGLRRALLQVGRAVMLVVLIASAVAVSVGLAVVARERPTTSALNPASSSTSSTSSSVAEAAAATGATGGTAASSAAQQAELLSGQDNRVLGLLRDLPYDGAAYTDFGKQIDTLVLTARTQPYTRADLVRLGALDQLSNGRDYLSASVLVAPGATLRIDGSRPLLMRSGAQGFASITAWKAQLELTGTAAKPLQISSWSRSTGTADTTEGDGRAYLRSVDSRTVVDHVALSDLGFWSGRTGGLAIQGGTSSVGTGGVAAAAQSPVAGRRQVSVTDLVTHRLHYGLFLDDVHSGQVTNARLLGSTAQGVLLHGNTHDVTLTSTTANRSGADGVAVARGSHDLVLDGVTAASNHGSGIRIDGRAGAVGPSAGGADPTRHGHVRITDATLTGNSGSGAAIVGAVSVSVADSTVRGNRDGVTVRDDASKVTVRDNHIDDSSVFGVGITDGPTSVLVTGNDVDKADTGVGIRAAVATVRGNTISHATGHGISLTGKAPGTEVLGNTFAGRGPAAIGLTHLVAPATVVVASNDESGWQVDKDLTWVQRLEDHPLLLLWLPILMLPLAAGIISIRRRRRAADERSRSQRSRKLAVARAAAPAGSAGQPSGPVPGSDHPAVVGSDARTRTRVTVMS